MKARVALLLFAFVCVARSAHAQADTLGYSAPTPAWVGQFTTLSANAVLGGLTSGIMQKVRGGSFKDGFTRGAFGGAVIYAGKYIAAERFFGAGFLGREVAAVGASVVRNASDGRPSLDRLILPVGITRVYWERAAKRVAVKVDVVAVGFIAYAVLEEELELNVRESLSAGTAVFETDNKVIATGSDDNHAAGVARGGILFRSAVPGWGEEFLERALAHERVHLLQDDQIFATLNDHADDWLFAKLGRAGRVGRYIDLNVSFEMLNALSNLIPRHRDRPWEMEAIYLTR